MSNYKLSIPPPTLPERTAPTPLLCGPGPCNLWPSVIEVLNRPVIQPWDGVYFWLMEDITKGLQYAFQTKSKLVLAVSGAGHAGMETVISNLVAPGEKMLIISRGVWDQRALSMAKRYGVVPIVHQTALNGTFNIEDLEPLLQKHRPTAVFVTHGDSSTGTVQKINGFGDLCHKYEALLLVDTVVSLGGVPFLMDDWGVDGVYSGAQKALSGPAGIAPVAFSARAEEKIKNRKHEPPFYFDVTLLAQQWNCYGNTRVYHHTMSPPLVWALWACVREIAKETLPVSWKRHETATKHFHDRLKKLPVEFFVPKPEDRLDTVTTVLLPNGYEYVEVIKHIREKFNIVIFGGVGPTAGKCLRIGIMGINATIEVADKVADALEDSLMYLSKAKL